MANLLLSRPTILTLGCISARIQPTYKRIHCFARILSVLRDVRALWPYVDPACGDVRGCSARTRWQREDGRARMLASTTWPYQHYCNIQRGRNTLGGVAAKGEKST